MIGQASVGLGVGLLTSAFLLGMRHGVDWDHIAAITDLTATQEHPRRGVALGMLYALGHGLVVLAIGVVAIVAGKGLPGSLDALFGRIVGWTLVLLGLYVLWALVKHRKGFRMQSRWMLVIGGVRRLVRRFGRRGPVSHEHPHGAHDAVHHDESGDQSSGPTVHSHAHTHDPAWDYGARASFGVGMLHGVGAETPTQVVAFLAASRAGGTAAGVFVLVAFLVGLFLSNTLMTVASAYGFKEAARRRRVQLSLGIVTAAVSLVVGGLLVLGQDAVLPAFFVG
jgi:high-affinity nickel permease